MRKTVAQFANRDLASELLRDVRIESSVLCRSTMAAPWGFGVAGRTAGSFHMVLAGQGVLEVDGAPDPTPIKAGDIAVLPRGSTHWVRDSKASDAPALTAILATHELIDGELHFGGDDGPLTEIVCGVFTLEDIGVAPWVERLPPVILSRVDEEHGAGDIAWVGSVVGALRDEARSPTPGGAGTVNRLLEALVVDALRTALAPSQPDGDAAVEALADHRIGRVIAQLHARPEAPWSVAGLAQVAAMSRSAFAERFRSIVGEPAMRYLAGVRLRRAARLLRSTDDTLAEIAQRVGYGSEAALSRAFRARYGSSPSATRLGPPRPHAATAREAPDPPV